MKATFETDDVHPRHRVDVWRAAVTDNFIPIAVQDYPREGFTARYDAVDVGGLSISRFRGTEQTFVRSPDLIRDRDADFYVAVIQRAGSLSLDHHGHTEGSRQGTISLVDVTLPYRLKLADELDILDVFIPRRDLDRALGATRAAVGLSIGPDQASSGLIRGFFSELLASGDALAPAVADRMSTIGVDLLAAGFAERLGQDPAKSHAGAATVYRAKSVVESRLGDPDLDTTAVAHELRLSPRRLQEIFRAEGLSVESWIRERRLARADLLLSDPACAAVPVAVIAYRCGFVSQAHFARCFKERFGDTPTERRAVRASR